MAQNITWADRTDATTATGDTDEWGKDQANPLKAHANAPSQDLSTWTPGATVLDGSGTYDSYTVTGNVVIAFSGTPQEGNWQKIRMTGFNGVHTLTIPELGVIINSSFTDGLAIATGTYDLWMVYADGEYQFNLVLVTIKAIVFPTITSLTISDDNTYADLLLSEGVYGANDGSTPASLSDLSVVFAQAGGTATAWTESSAKQNDNTSEGSASALVGGETTIRIFGAITGVADGNETLTVSPADGSSLYDADGNAVDSGESAVDNLSIILFQDNFAGVTIDTAKWDIVNPDSANTVISQNETLIFDSDGTISVPWANNYPQSDDSFDISVNGAMSVDLVSASGVNDREFGIIAASVGGNTSFNLRRKNTGEANTIFVDSTGSVVLNEVDAVELIGKSIRFIVVAGVVSSQYHNGTSWVTLRSFDFSGNIDNDLKHRITCGNSILENAEVTVFDNTYITSVTYSTKYPA